MDRRAHGHQAAPHRARRRDNLHAGRGAPRAGDGRAPRCTPGELDADRARHGDARPSAARRRPSTSRPRWARRARPRSTSAPRARGVSTALTVAEGLMAIRRRRDGARRRRREAERHRRLDRTGRRACCSATARARRCSSARKQQQGHSVHVHAQRRHARRAALPSGGRRGDAVQRRRCSSDRSHFIKMAGREVFKHAVRSMSEAARSRARRREAHGHRHRPADPAPGEHPHHRGDGEARRASRWRRST